MVPVSLLCPKNVPPAHALSRLSARLLNAGGMRLATTEATAENSSQLMRHRDALTPLGFKSLYTSKEHRDSLLAVPVLFGGEGGI